MRDDYWDDKRAARGWGIGGAGMGALRVALLFGSAAVALALIIAPIAENQVARIAYSGYPAGVDMMATGTVGQRGNGYTIRRSVLQPTPASVCIIRDNGTRSGDC